MKKYLINKKTAISRFCRSLAVLIESNVPISEALDCAGAYCGNEFIFQKIKEGKKFADTEEIISASLIKAGVFSPMVIQIITGGEEKGNLISALYRISDTYNTELEFVTERISAVLESIMVILAAIVVSYVVSDIFMPNYCYHCCIR